MDKQDLIVIGGGTSGFMVATGALRLGLKVILIERNASLGGLALHFGCVPSKAMLHVAQVVHTVQNSRQYGLETEIAATDLGKVNDHVNNLVRRLKTQETQEAQNIFKQLGGKLLFGEPKFVDSHTIVLGSEVIESRKFVIATGSRSIFPAIRDLDKVGYITNDTVFAQTKLPAQLIILGDKPSAVEFAQAFARLGSKVTLVVSGDSILPQEDPELVSRLKDVLMEEGVDFQLNTTVHRAYLQHQQKYLECQHDSGENFILHADEILVALGRRPNVEGLGLENAGVTYASDGILVNKKLTTSQNHIYALGDVIRSPYKLTHAAEYQASIVLSNAVFRYPATVKYQGFPYVIFTDPEYAHVGLTEAQAKEQGYKNLEVLRFEFKDLDSALIKNAPAGLIKVITCKDRIIGATILGSHASNLIAEWGLALNMRAHLADVATTIHAYPTLAQINRRVASKRSTKGLFSDHNKLLVSLLQRVFVWA